VSRRVGVFPAKMEALARVAAFVEDAGAAAEFDRHDRLRLTLVVEELFTNTVAHGHGGDSEGPIQIALEVQRGRVAVTYEDTGPPFDPVAIAQRPDASATLDAPEEWPLGKLGLILLARLTTNLEYRYAEGRNRISLVMLASR
jgi:serine/threonine-protein kinase RsbW